MFHTAGACGMPGSSIEDYLIATEKMEGACPGCGARLEGMGNGEHDDASRACHCPYCVEQCSIGDVGAQQAANVP